MESSELADFRWALYHSWRFWTSLLTCAGFIVAGILWLRFGWHDRIGGAVIGGGLIGLSVQFANRWALDHGRPMLYEWVPSRRAFLAPLGLLIIGVLLLVLAPGKTNPVKGFGLLLACFSVPLAGGIAIRRATMVVTDDPQQQDE